MILFPLSSLPGIFKYSNFELSNCPDGIAFLWIYWIEEYIYIYIYIYTHTYTHFVRDAKNMGRINVHIKFMLFTWSYGNTVLEQYFTVEMIAS